MRLPLAHLALATLTALPAGCAAEPAASAVEAPQASAPGTRAAGTALTSAEASIGPAPSASALGDAPSPAPASTAASAVLPPYPEAFIAKALSNNRERSCQQLVYKRGCAETRTGTITAKVTLAADGSVASFEVTANQIRRDPKLVEDCVKKHLPTWVFDPPAGTSPTFELVLRFGDKC